PCPALLGGQHLSQEARALWIARVDDRPVSRRQRTLVIGGTKLQAVFLDATAVIAVTFLGTVIAAIILPWRRKDIYDASPIARYKVGGIPLITITGVITAAFLVFLIGEWSFNGANLYYTALNQSLPSVIYFAATYVVALVIYLVARYVRSRQGIDLSRIHHEIPVE